jgi:hypothetical protein
MTDSKFNPPPQAGRVFLAVDFDGIKWGDHINERLKINSHCAGLEHPIFQK